MTVPECTYTDIFIIFTNTSANHFGCNCLLHVITEFEDDGEHIYKVKIEELPGLEVYAHTIDEVLSELDEAKNAWFQTALELKREIKEPNDSLHEYSGRTIQQSVRQQNNIKLEYKFVNH